MGALGLGRFGYTMLLPATREGLGLTYTEAGLLGTANLAGYLAGSLLAGCATPLGPRLAAASGLVAVGVSLAWTGLAGSASEAAVARYVAGLAAAIVYVQALGLVGHLPADVKGWASGVMHGGNGAGLIVTGLGVPSILASTGHDGWRTSWLVLGVATLALAPAAWSTLRPGALPRPAAALDAQGPRPAESAPSVVTWAGLSGLFGVAYIVYVTFFAEALRSQGMSLTQTGRAWAAVGALSLISGPGWGALSDRIGRMAALTLLFGLQGVAYAGLLVGTSWSLIVSVTTFGPTAWAIPTVTAAAMGDRRPGEAVIAFGRVTTVSGLGQAVGPFLAGVVADARGDVGSGLWVSIAAAALGTLWSLGYAMRGQRTPSPEPHPQPGPPPVRRTREAESNERPTLARDARRSSPR